MALATYSLPLWQVADVILGCTSGALHGAAFLAEKPLVLYRPSQYVLHPAARCENSSWYEDAHRIVMGRNEATVFTEKDADFVRDVARAIYSGANKSQVTTQESQRRARQQYFERFRGVIDGYEDYRLAICVLERARPPHLAGRDSTFSQALRELRRLYLQFPEFRGRPLADPNLSCEHIMAPFKWR